MIEKLLKLIEQDSGPNVFNTGASDSQIDNAEKIIGTKFPTDFRQMYKDANGETGSLLVDYEIPAQFFVIFDFLSLQDVIETHEFLTDSGEGEYLFDDELFSHPPHCIKKCFFNKKWIPFGTSGSGFYLAIDMDPDAQGSIGQVIIFGGSILPDRYVVAESLRTFIDELTTVLSKNKLWSDENDEYFDKVFQLSQNS